MIEASAPAKVMIAGEYTVLDGAPAVMAAVSRRATVTLQPTDEDFHSVRAPGFTDALGRFEWTGTEVRWQSGGDDFRLFESVLNAAQPGLESPFAFTLDTNAFYSNGDKLGLGSSASLAAALAAAIGDLTELPPALVAMQGHRDFQGGSGSGADVASSSAGGLIEYRVEDSGWTRLDWPEGLHFRLYASGSATITTDQIDKYKALEPGRAHSMLTSLANEVAELFREPSIPGLLGVLRRYTLALQEFDAVNQLGIFDNGHAALANVSPEHGLVYKPCGAGGGDIGIAVAHEESRLLDFDAVAEQEGFRPLDVSLDPLGARLTT